MRTSLFALQVPMIAARELATFQTEGLPPAQYLTARASTEQLEALSAGAVDVACTAADNVIEAQLTGRGLRIFHVADLGMDQFAVAGRGIDDWDAVRGRAVGVDSATSGYAYVLYQLLADHSIARDEVEIVELGGPAGRFSGLNDGSIAVGMLNPVFTGRARAAGLAVLAEGGERFPDYPNLVFAATETALAADPESFAAYARAVDRALAWVDDDANADAAVALIGAVRELDEPTARRVHAEERALRRVSRPDGTAVRRGLSIVADLRRGFTGVSLEPDGFATRELLAR